MLNQEDVAGFMAEVEASRAAASQDADRKQNMDELLAYCSSWLTASQGWRKQSFEDKWLRHQRDADAIYDPQLKASKAKWQSKAFIPITPSHRENIHARLYKMIVGARPVLEMRSRFEMPPELDQSENICDLILREFEKSRFEVGFNPVLDDADTYGSGFCRIRFEEETDERKLRQPVYGPVDPLQAEMAAAQGQMPAQIVGYEDVMQEQVIYRGVKYEHLSIWDVFPDPKALQVKGNAIAYRFHYVYGDVVKGVEKGYFFPEAQDALRDIDQENKQPAEKKEVESSRNVVQGNVNRTTYGKRIECFELYARLPKKWVFMHGEPVDDPEKLVPARIIFVPGKVVLAAEVNEAYDGEPPIYKMDYLPVAGQFYGRGIPEMLKDIQDVVNESVNQRLDANAILLRPKFAMIDKALVNRKDLDWDGDTVIRLNGKYVTDVRQAFQQVNLQELGRMAIIEPQEMERYAQERSSANRVTLGTAGQVKDANQTLGGQELLMESAGEKFAYIGMLMEFSALYEFFRAFWKQIYANITPDDVVAALGPERAQTFQLLTPEQIEREYVYQPQGIFEMQNKGMLQARLQALVQMFGDQPWFDIIAAYSKIAKTADIEPDELMLSPEEVYEKAMADGIMQMNQEPVKPPPQAKGQPNA